MSKKPINHVNLVDDSGQVYCHKEGDIVTFDGPFVAKDCWPCPLFLGLAGGYGVECLYKDENLGDGVEKMTYRNAEDARDHAPETTKNLNSIADKDAIKMTAMRMKNMSDQEEIAQEVQQDKQDAADKDVETANAAAESAAPTVDVSADTGASAEEPSTVPPEAPNTLQMAKATSLDVLAVLTKAKTVLPEIKFRPLPEVTNISSADAMVLFPGMVPEIKALPYQMLPLAFLIEKARGKKGGMDTSDPGLFTRCMSTSGAKNASDPGAYCAAIHQNITGHWPAQDKPHKGKKG